MTGPRIRVGRSDSRRGMALGRQLPSHPRVRTTRRADAAATLAKAGGSRSSGGVGEAKRTLRIFHPEQGVALCLKLRGPLRRVAGVTPSAKPNREPRWAE